MYIHTKKITAILFAGFMLSSTGFHAARAEDIIAITVGCTSYLETDDSFEMPTELIAYLDDDMAED